MQPANNPLKYFSNHQYGFDKNYNSSHKPADHMLAIVYMYNRACHEAKKVTRNIGPILFC